MQDNTQQPQVRYLSTEEFAQKHFVKPASVRSHVCRVGSYYGVRPMKLVNGRLGWPVTDGYGEQAGALKAINTPHLDR